MNTIRAIAYQNETLDEVCHRLLGNTNATDWAIKHNPKLIHKTHLNQGDLVILPQSLPMLEKKERVQLWS